MKTHLICWARNEADILEAHVRHHAGIADRLTYVLHRCRDNSSEILTGLASEGIAVTFTTDEQLLHAQKEAMTNMMRDAAKQNADWILPLDADEFLCGEVLKTLVEADPSSPLSVPWRGYVPLPADPAAETNVLRRITHRRSSEQPQWNKVLIPRAIALETQAVLGFGSHGVQNGKGMYVEAKDCPLHIAHFPIRSEAQFRRKIYGGWLSHLADPARAAGTTFQWEVAYRELMRDGRLSPERLERSALNYAGLSDWASFSPATRIPGATQRKEAASPPVIVSDPVLCDFTLRYDIREADPVSVLMETAEELARSLAKSNRA